MAEREIRLPDDTGISRILLINAGVLLATLLSYPIFYSAGMWSSATAGYIVITIGIFSMCIIALTIANSINPTVGLTFYAWAGFFAIFGMLMLDILNGAREFPWVLYCLHGGVLGLGYFEAKLHKTIYTVAAVVAVVLAGSIYTQYDQAIACCVSLVFIALWRF